MAKPQVACATDVVVSYDVSARLISLGAAATNTPILEWKWTILAVPPGSSAHVGTKGDFVDGISAVQNPDLLIDAAIDGGYTLQCEARNADGWSEAFIDRRDAQQLIIVRTNVGQLWLPGDYAYDWGELYLNQTLRRLAAIVIGHHETHENSGGDDISVAGLSGVLADEQDAGELKGQTISDLSGASYGDVLTYVSPGVWSAEAGSSGDSYQKDVKITVGNTAGNYDSTFSVPVGAMIKRVTLKILTAYNGSATISIRLNGSSTLNLQLTTENNPAIEHDYQTEPMVGVTSGYNGVVRCVVGGTPTVGSAEVLIELVTQTTP
jgi:hypothetical protein